MHTTAYHSNCASRIEHLPDCSNRRYVNQVHTLHEVIHQTISVDKEGYPTIPDIASYIRALELYIKKKWFTILFDLGKLNVSIYNNVKQEYAFAVAQAQSELIKPSLDEMEAFTNMWNSLLPRHSAHKFGYSTVGSKEINKI